MWQAARVSHVWSVWHRLALCQGRHPDGARGVPVVLPVTSESGLEGAWHLRSSSCERLPATLQSRHLSTPSFIAQSQTYASVYWPGHVCNG